MIVSIKLLTFTEDFIFGADIIKKVVRCMQMFPLMFGERKNIDWFDG